MEFIKSMYLGNNINQSSVINKLNHKGVNLYYICICQNSNSIMEIIHSHEIHKEVYKNKDYIVIGLANSKEEAKKIVCSIIEDMYKENNELSNLKELLLQSLYKKE